MMESESVTRLLTVDEAEDLHAWLRIEVQLRFVDAVHRDFGRAIFVRLDHLDALGQLLLRHLFRVVVLFAIRAGCIRPRIVLLRL